MKSFEELECWKKATELRRKLSVLVKSFPSEERYRLCDQIIRASRSVTANIAEGYGRFHFQENIQFCRQGRGSLFELIDHLVVASDEGYISEGQLIDLKREIHECLALLNGFINYLGKAKSGGSYANEPALEYRTPDNY
ncbi:MAG: four helix bundle protein [Flammeovirgaceae bacterium]|nr:four helix bundle protein [Flammeovirgaceae bacterium]